MDPSIGAYRIKYGFNLKILPSKCETKEEDFNRLFRKIKMSLIQTIKFVQTCCHAYLSD